MFTTHVLSCQLPGRYGPSENGVLYSPVALKDLLDNQVMLRTTSVAPIIEKDFLSQNAE